MNSLAHYSNEQMIAVATDFWLKVSCQAVRLQGHQSCLDPTAHRMAMDFYNAWLLRLQILRRGRQPECPRWRARWRFSRST